MWVAAAAHCALGWGCTGWRGSRCGIAGRGRCTWRGRVWRGCAGWGCWIRLVFAGRFGLSAVALGDELLSGGCGDDPGLGVFGVWPAGPTMAVYHGVVALTVRSEVVDTGFAAIGMANIVMDVCPRRGCVTSRKSASAVAASYRGALVWCREPGVLHDVGDSTTSVLDEHPHVGLVDPGCEL